MPSARSRPDGLPSSSSVAVRSRTSSTIWKMIPAWLPYSVSASTVGRSSPPTMAPIRQAVAMSEAVFPAMEPK